MQKEMTGSVCGYVEFCVPVGPPKQQFGGQLGYMDAELCWI